MSRAGRSSLRQERRKRASARASCRAASQAGRARARGPKSRQGRPSGVTGCPRSRRPGAMRGRTGCPRSPADRPPLAGVDDAAAERFDPPQRLGDVAHREVGQGTCRRALGRARGCRAPDPPSASASRFPPVRAGLRVRRPAARPRSVAPPGVVRGELDQRQGRVRHPSARYRRAAPVLAADTGTRCTRWRRYLGGVRGGASRARTQRIRPRGRLPADVGHLDLR